MAPRRPLNQVVSYRSMPGGRYPEGDHPGPGRHMNHPEMCDDVKRQRDRSPRSSGGAVETKPSSFLTMLEEDGVSMSECWFRPGNQPISFSPSRPSSGRERSGPPSPGPNRVDGT